MLTIEGTYKNGKVELAEAPPQLKQSRVLVTFLESAGSDLRLDSVIMSDNLATVLDSEIDSVIAASRG
jgi:hypothetical protein